MKIAFNPSTVAALITPPNNKDITFDLRGRNIFARGVKFQGTDTWRDIKINNVSIGSNILDLRNGSNTTLINTNGVVTINSTWRPVVDNLTSDSTTSSLSAKQGKVLKSLIDGKSNSGHTHDDRYLKLTGGTMASNALITFADSGSWGTNKGPQGARGGLYWTGQSDYAKLYAEETREDNLDLVIQFGDDNSNGLSIRNKANTQTSYISAGGIITTGTFKGNLDWSYITNKPSSYTPSAHTHAWNSLTHSSTTENQAILTNGKENGWKLYTLNIPRWDNAANNAHSHSNKSVLDGITSALVNNWNVAYTFVNTITGTDTDKVINKWDEIVNFLAGITEDNKLNTLLNSKLSVYELANNTNVGTIKNNGIYYSTTDASSGTLTNSPFNTGFALINMTSYDGGDDLRRSRLAFNAYGEIRVSNDRDQANAAETWYNVLTSKNSGINGSTIKLNGTSITVYSSSTADGRYVKKSGDTMSGVLTIDTTNFGALIIKRNDDANGASIQFRGKSSIYGYIGLNNSTKDKLFLRWGSDTSKAYTILDTSSTYTSNGKGYINGTEITLVNNADKVDNRHAISTTPNTGIIYKAAIYTSSSLTSYWVRLASIPSISLNSEFIATIHVLSGHSNPGRSAILLVYLRGSASSFMSKSFKIGCNSNYDPNRFRLYYKDSDKTSEIWYQTTGLWDGIITTVISLSSEGSLYEGLTLYSGSITAVQTPSVSTYLSALISTITDNISGNASSATKLQTPRNIWGQSFDGTADISGTLSGVGHIQFSADNTYNIGSNSAASKYIYTYWLGAKSGLKLELGANNSNYGLGLCIDTNLNVGIGTSTPAYKLDVVGNIRATGQIIREGSSLTWVNGRRGALLRETTSAGYHTLWSLKTTNGSWDFGEYNSSGWNNIPVLSYITDTNFNSGNNTTTYQIKFPLDSGTIALTKNIPSSVKNPYSLTTFGVVYDGSAAKVVSPSNFISLVNEATSTVTDGTMFITSYASNSGFADTNAVNVPYKRKAIHLWEYIKTKTDSLYTTKSHNHDDRYVRAFGTSNDNIDSDWGLSFKTFDPIPSGTPPEKNPNISILNIGNNFDRRKLLAFIYSSDNIYYRRHVNGNFTNWRRLAFANEIPTSLKNPHSLTLKANGTTLAVYDGSSAKEANFTYTNIGAASASHTHSYITISTCSTLNENSNNFSVEYAGGGNSVITKPSGVDAFSVMKLRTASGWYGLILMSNSNGIYYRSANGLTSSINWIKLLDSNNSSVSGGGNVWGSSITVKINGTSKTLTIPSNPNTDYRVTQSETTTANYRPLVLGYTNVSTAGSEMTGSVTNQVYLSNKFYVQPSTGNLYATTFVGALSGNATTATKLTSSAGNAALPVYFSDGKPVACTASLIFSNLSNNGNNLSVTVAGLNRTLTVGYATNADKLDGYHANGLLTSVTNTNNGISVTVGGTTKSVSNISVNYAASAESASSATQATNLTPENTPHYFRDPYNSIWRGGMYWGNAGSESMSFVAANGGTRFQFVGGSDIANWTNSTWQSVTPYLTIYSSGIVTPGSVTATNGFHHVNHDNNDAVLLAGGGYSQGVPVKYWSIESISIYGPTSVARTNRGGNYTFVTKVEPRIKGSCTLTLQFPSGYNNKNTIIWAMGVLNDDISDSDNSAIYATMLQFSGPKYYLNLSDDDSLNNGSCQLYFMCF